MLAFPPIRARPSQHNTASTYDTITPQFLHGENAFYDQLFARNLLKCAKDLFLQARLEVLNLWPTSAGTGVGERHGRQRAAPSGKQASKWQVGDRVELLLFYGFDPNAPLPQGTVVGAIPKCIHAKMDRTGKVVRFDPKDLRVINGKKVHPTLES